MLINQIFFNETISLTIDNTCAKTGNSGNAYFIPLKLICKQHPLKRANISQQTDWIAGVSTCALGEQDKLCPHG